VLKACLMAFSKNKKEWDTCVSLLPPCSSCSLTCPLWHCSWCDLQAPQPRSCENQATPQAVGAVPPNPLHSQCRWFSSSRQGACCPCASHRALCGSLYRGGDCTGFGLGKWTCTLLRVLADQCLYAHTGRNDHDQVPLSFATTSRLLLQGTSTIDGGTGHSCT
jgi:hypothetical protein